MNKNRFGLMLDDKTTAKLFTLAKKSKQEPYHYLTKLINEFYFFTTKEILYTSLMIQLKCGISAMTVLGSRGSKIAQIHQREYPYIRPFEVVALLVSLPFF